MHSSVITPPFCLCLIYAAFVRSHSSPSCLLYGKIVFRMRATFITKDYFQFTNYWMQVKIHQDLHMRLSESVATLPPFVSIEGQKWFDQIPSQWESQKNRFALIYFGKIQFLPSCIWNIPFMSYRLWIFLRGHTRFSVIVVRVKVAFEEDTIPVRVSGSRPYFLPLFRYLHSGLARRCKIGPRFDSRPSTRGECCIVNWWE